MNQNDSLVLMNYKEPLKEVPKAMGFGYYGAILITPDGDKMQCHVCGKLFSDVGFHSYRTHNLSAKEYKETYELSQSTALISENKRQKAKDNMMRRLENMTDEEIQEKLRKQAERMRNLHKSGKVKYSTERERLEAKNKKGTCPDQLLAKLTEVSEQLGHTPSVIEFVSACGGSQRYIHLINRTFGSFTKAVAKAKLSPKKREAPHESPRYSEDELLDALLVFYQENGKVPTATDAKRGFIPSEKTYCKRFGSLPRAREIAGIHETPHRWSERSIKIPT